MGRYHRKVWGGFVDGRLHLRMIDSNFGGWGHNGMYALAIFTSKARARLEYEDVRAVEIRELTSPTEKDDGHGRG